MEVAQILVVEDERITANDIKYSLEKVGHHVPAMVSTGEDAIEKAGEFRPDLVLMDIKLEGKIDGIEAAEAIRSKFAIPVIYLTCYSDENTIERVKTSQPSAYILKEPFEFLHKPFIENELFTAINIILYRKVEEDKINNKDKLVFSILETINEGVITTDNLGNIKFMNTAAEKLSGWDEQDSLGLSIHKIFPDQKLNIDIPYKSDLEDASGENVYIRALNNDKIPVKGTLIPLGSDDANNGVIILFQKV